MDHAMVGLGLPTGLPVAYPLMAPDGSNAVQLTTDADTDSQPAWSPDGTRLAFVSTRTGVVEIWRMNFDGSGQQQHTAEAAVDVDPEWSPDGTKIAFTSTRDGNSNIYVMLSDGSAPTRYTTEPASDEFPSWRAG